MKKIKLLSVLAMSLLAFAFTSCNTGDSDGFQWPTPQESQALFSQIQGMHNGGILFPGSVGTTVAEKFDKDSVTTYCYVTPSDSMLTIRQVEVSKFAKYFNDATLKAEVEKLPAQDLKIKLVPYNYNQQMFITATQDITYTKADGKKVQIQFYSGLSNYSLAYIGTKKTNNKKELGVYITPGRVLVDGQTKTSALKTYTYGGYAQAYCAMLEMEL